MFLASPKTEGIPNTIKLVCDNGVYSRYLTANSNSIGCGCKYSEGYDYNDCEIISRYSENTVDLILDTNYYSVDKEVYWGKL